MQAPARIIFTTWDIYIFAHTIFLLFAGSSSWVWVGCILAACINITPNNFFLCRLMCRRGEGDDALLVWGWEFSQKKIIFLASKNRDNLHIFNYACGLSLFKWTSQHRVSTKKNNKREKTHSVMMSRRVMCGGGKNWEIARETFLEASLSDAAS